MSVYTVHEPPTRAGAAASDVERFAFVRDGFSWWAFLFAPLWMLRHRMWLVLIGYVVVVGAIEIPVRMLRCAGFRSELHRHSPWSPGRARGRHLAPFHAEPARLEKSRRRQR